MSNESKPLYRSKEDRWLAGVCGGLAKHFSVDVTLIRILFILFTLIIGGGVIIYILLWVLIPPEPDELLSSGEATTEED